MSGTWGPEMERRWDKWAIIITINDEVYRKFCRSHGRAPGKWGGEWDVKEWSSNEMMYWS